LSGSIDQISHLNEKKVQATLKAIAKNLVVECQEGIGKCNLVEKEWKRELEVTSKDQTQSRKGLEEMLEWLGMVTEIWKGEETIAKAIAED
jgi:hypothetical protein